MTPRHATSADLTTPDAVCFRPSRALHHNIILFITQHNGANHTRATIPDIIRQHAARNTTAYHLHHNVKARLCIDLSDRPASQLSP